MAVPGEMKAGRISKPYGLQGQVIINLDPNAGERIKEDNPLFINMDGQRVPFFVEEFEMISPDQAIIKFEFIEGVEDAKGFNGCEVYFDISVMPEPSRNREDFSALIGYDAFDMEEGHLGKVTGYADHEMNPVMIIESPGKELLVPAPGNFVIRIDHKGHSIHFRLPVGLTSL